jgi:hypothetical protein
MEEESKSEKGRPALFKTPEELNAKTEQYFNKNLNPTVTGLCLFLGFESRQSFYDYESKEDFSYTIKRARLRIESWYEQNLLSKNSTGAIFALKNFGWSDKHEIDHKNNGNDFMPYTINVMPPSDRINE